MLYYIKLAHREQEIYAGSNKRTRDFTDYLESVIAYLKDNRLHYIILYYIILYYIYYIILYYIIIIIIII